MHNVAGRLPLSTIYCVSSYVMEGEYEVMGEDQDPGRSIKVLLADDHTMFRQGIAGLLAGYGGMEVVGQTDNDEGAVEVARRTKPDIVLMQVQMPISKAKENLRRIREKSPPPRVIIVTMIEDPRQVRELMELGVSAYILKSASAEHLVAAIRAAILDPKSKSVVVGMPLGLLEEAEDGSGGVLSARELEILLLTARGLSNHQIATRIYLAEGTVKRHLANIFEKMDVRSRGEATRKALLAEWITIHDVADDDLGGEQ
jgi:DNA-binding NarL/FixJ family response regulator